MAGFDFPGPTCVARGDTTDPGTLWGGLMPPRLLEPQGLAHIFRAPFDAPPPQPASASAPSSVWLS